jgi:hypothetical protein
MWRGQRVFIDGRLVSSQVTGLYLDVVNARPGWSVILDSYSVNYILMPVMSEENGSIAPIAMEMAERKPAGWRLVYLYDNKAVFLRDSPANRRVIEEKAMPFGEIYREVNDMADLLLISRPWHPGLLRTKAIALERLKGY